MKNHRDYVKTKGVFSSVSSAVVAVMVYRCKQGKKARQDLSRERTCYSAN